MKKLKYILSFLIVIGGFIISNFSYAQIFGDDEENIPTSPSFNIVESVHGSNITRSDPVINNNITSPIFQRIGSFINAVLEFWPVICMILFFWLAYGLFKGLFITKKDKKNKSLENK